MTKFIVCPAHDVVTSLLQAMTPTRHVFRLVFAEKERDACFSFRSWKARKLQLFWYNDQYKKKIFV